MRKLALLVLSLAVIPGCTSNPTKPAAEPQPPQLLTGRSAFQHLYVAARGWAPDARPYQLQSSVVGDQKGADGKAVVWRAAFASARLRASKPYTWSGIDSPDAPSRGISPGTQDPYTPGNDFDIQFLKIDSDKALEVAEKHGGEKIHTQNAAIPIMYLLDWNRSENQLVWHVIYGNNRNDAKLVADVDASSGAFLRKED
ncbi:MAG: hypothetical protein JO159_08725 [Acidobacteria bacterium]|nr:hypothetical protein [Acidobacteriota bacterium]MBV9622887.1 hypothetical protein [Acidobacteriota bacterium]